MKWQIVISIDDGKMLKEIFFVVFDLQKPTAKRTRDSWWVETLISAIKIENEKLKELPQLSCDMTLSN